MKEIFRSSRTTGEFRIRNGSFMINMTVKWKTVLVGVGLVFAGIFLGFASGYRLGVHRGIGNFGDRRGSMMRDFGRNYGQNRGSERGRGTGRNGLNDRQVNPVQGNGSARNVVPTDPSQGSASGSAQGATGTVAPTGSVSGSGSAIQSQ